MSTEEKILFKVWNSSRTIKKMVLTQPTILGVIEEAKKKDLIGTQLVLESDGTIIDEDEILKMCAELPLIVLNSDEEWTPALSFQRSGNLSDNTELVCLNIGQVSQPQLQPEAHSSQLRLNSVSSHNSDFEVIPTNCESDILLHSLELQNQSQSNSSFSNVSLGTTLTMSSGVLSSEKENSYATLSVKRSFDSFAIPWGKLPKIILDACEKQQKLGPHLKTLIHIIVDELRAISFYIPIPVFRKISAKMASKYPKTFSYSDGDGNPIPISNSPLITSMIQRNNYLNRPKTNFKRTATNIPIKKKRLSKNFEETCVNWDISPENDENEDFIEDKRKTLIELSSLKVYSKDQFETIKILMEATYGGQRRFLNNFKELPVYSSIKQNWPFLLHKVFIYEHFSKLTEVNPERIILNFENKNQKIIKFAMEKKGKLLAEMYSKSGEDYAGIFFICRYLNEQFEYIAKTFPMGTTQQEVRPQDNCPWIGIIETNSDPIYYIYLDGAIANTQSTNFKESLIQVICMFFNFNREYPEQVSLTYEFIQRYICDMNVEKSRGKKKNISSIAKVIRLIDKIRQVNE